MGEKDLSGIASVISSITSDPEMMSKLRGAVSAASAASPDGGDAGTESAGEDRAPSLPDLSPRRGAPSWSASDRKKLLEALRPFLSEERREKADALINVMALLDSGLIDMIGKERR